VTRIHTVPLKIGELFYMRVLLQHRPTFGFQDLRTVSDQVYPTYQEAATVMGLFDNVSEAVHAMEEAVAAYSRSGQLRFLFAHLLLDLPTPAITLWERFREPLSADFALHHRESEAIRLTLDSISRVLRSQGATLRQFGLPESTKVEREIHLELNAFASSRDALLSRNRWSYGMLNSISTSGM
jgi:hypothetical protein